MSPQSPVGSTSWQEHSPHTQVPRGNKELYTDLVKKIRQRTFSPVVLVFSVASLVFGKHIYSDKKMFKNRKIPSEVASRNSLINKQKLSPMFTMM